ncbi:MAG: hypothetical protein ILP09_08810, partial [Oscillospiraceae bacterium]|nr:hypothetical protein [Oscillospiraceae bacterium]
LKENCALRKAFLTWREGPDTIQLQVSDDSENWLPLSEADHTGEKESVFELNCRARYVRPVMYVTDGRPIIMEKMQIFGEGSRPYENGGAWRIARAEDVNASGKELSGQYDDTEWLPAEVPGTALVSWMRAGAVLDPDIGDDQFQVSDAYFNCDYWYRMRFDEPEGSGRLWLNFDAINWKAEVWLNGEKLGDINGAFIRAKFDITAAVKKTGNALAVLIRKNANPGPVKVHTLESSGPNGGPLGADNPTIHASAGWDWVTTIRGRNSGIYGKVYFSRSVGAVLAENSWVKTKLEKGGDARLTVETELRNTSERAVKAAFRGSISPAGVVFESAEVMLAAGEKKKVAAEVTLEKAKLWWPNTYGDQFLYTALLEAFENGEVSDTCKFDFGVRELSYDRQWPMKIYCNGVRIICRGGNWGMDDADLACTEEDYDTRVRFHKDLNFTMIRNWVGMTNNEAFYAACDRYGILVWDDFWLANTCDGPDPDDEDMFMRNACDKVRKNRRHPCVALYCGRNEGMPPDSLNKALEKLCREEDGTRIYIPHSAVGLVSGFGPYGALGPEYYFGHTYHTLHSERGMINIPSLESMREMLTPEHEWPIDEVWALHDFCRDSAQKAGEYLRQMEESYGAWDGFEDFVQTAQLFDYSNHKAMFEAVFAGQSQGMIMWMSNPAWPSMVWQTYDSRYDVNGGYQGCKDACRPVNAIYDVLREEIVLVNATSKPRRLTLRTELFSLSWERLRSDITEKDMPADSAEYAAEAPRWMDEVSFIRLTVSEQGERDVVNFYWTNGWNHTDYRALRSLKKAKLDSALEKTEEGFKAVLVNRSDVPAIMIELRLKDAETGRTLLPVFSESNFISLMPGESAETLLKCSAENAELALSGWNI